MPQNGLILTLLLLQKDLQQIELHLKKLKLLYMKTQLLLSILLVTLVSFLLPEKLGAQKTVVTDNSFGNAGTKHTTTKKDGDNIEITTELYDGSFPAKLRQRKVESKGNIDKSADVVLTEYGANGKSNLERRWELDAKGDLVAVSKREFDEKGKVKAGYSKIRSDNKWITEKYDPRTGKYVQTNEEINDPFNKTIVKSEIKAADLIGIWDAKGYGCSVSIPLEKIRIDIKEGKLVAVKMTGDDCVPAGEITWEGTLKGNIISAKGHVSSGPKTNMYWIETTITVVDRNKLTGFNGVTYQRVNK